MRRCPACRAEYADSTKFCPEDGTKLEAALKVDPLASTAVGARAGKDTLVGSVVAGRFRVEGPLGVGGVGAVYRVRHEFIGRTYALKLLHDDLARDQEAVQRFLVEARAVSRVAHENVIAISDFGRLEDGRYYLVLEYCDGPTLDELLRSEGALHFARALPLIRQTAAALAAIHAHGILHRDLKPKNILVTRDVGDRERIKLLDFGMARLGDATTRITQQGAWFGTPLYMAPEQIRGAEVDFRTDLYALGVCAFEILTGKPPYRAKTLEELFRQHTSSAPPELLGPQPIPGALVDLVRRWLDKEPPRRGESLAGCLDELDALALTLGISRSSSSGRRSRIPGGVIEPVQPRMRTSEPIASSHPLLGQTASSERQQTPCVATPEEEVDPAAVRQRYQRRLVELIQERWPDPIRVLPSVRRLLADLRAAEAELEERQTEQALVESEVEELLAKDHERQAMVRAALTDLGMERALLLEERLQAEQAAAVALTRDIEHLEGRMVDLERRIQEIEGQTKRAVEERHAIASDESGRVDALRARVDDIYERLAEHATRLSPGDATSQLLVEVMHLRRGLSP